MLGIGLLVFRLQARHHQGQRAAEPSQGPQTFTRLSTPSLPLSSEALPDHFLWWFGSRFESRSEDQLLVLTDGGWFVYLALSAPSVKRIELVPAGLTSALLFAGLRAGCHHHPRGGGGDPMLCA